MKTREQLTEQLAHIYTDDMDMADLEEYFYNKQIEFFNSLTDEEFYYICRDNIDLLD